MKALALAVGFFALMLTGALAQAPAAESCDAQAAAKKLNGAAKTSFVTKCKRDACASKAVSQDGKPLSGAAKNSFMTKCEKGA